MRGLIHALKGIFKQITITSHIGSVKTNYDDYWINKRGESLGFSNNWQKQRGDWIVSKIEENSSVLDIGCGDGGVLLYMKKKKSFNALGADISDICLNFLDSKNIDVIKFDINDFSGIAELPEVDHVMILEVLEHIPNPEKFLKMILPKAKKSIFFSFPNSGYISYRLRLLFGAFPMQWTVHPGEHLRFWTYRDLKWWLKELNFKNKSTVHIYEGIPFLNKVWKGLFGAGFIVEIKK
jgi:methionine biosynthesis protein MetW